MRATWRFDEFFFFQIFLVSTDVQVPATAEETTLEKNACEWRTTDKGGRHVVWCSKTCTKNIYLIYRYSFQYQRVAILFIYSISAISRLHLFVRADKENEFLSFLLLQFWLPLKIRTQFSQTRAMKLRKKIKLQFRKDIR